MFIAVRILACVVGSLSAMAVLLSAIKTVVLPRAEGSAITRAVFLLFRRLVFDRIAHERRTFEARDRVWAFYSPVTLIALPGVWVALIMGSFTCIFWGAGIGSWRRAFLTSGSSVLTLGVFFDHALPKATLSFVEATVGLGLVALMISYLPSIYGAFSRREQLVGMLEVRAGIPPSPAELLTRYSRIGWLGSIDTELFPRWEEWFADIEESHTSIPALVFFRSPQPERSWITAAGCVLDTAAIVSSTVERGIAPQANVLVRSGSFALGRIADYFGMEHDTNPNPDDPITVTRREFDLMCVELSAAGVPLKVDRDQAWRDFAGWRVNYDTVLIKLAAFVSAPPGVWSSDRGAVRHTPTVRGVGRRRRPR